jgi:hypothetical protein
LLLLGAHQTFACTCIVDSLGERFREAKAVFVGRAIAVEPQDKSLIQNISNKDKYSQILETVKSFKGIKKRFIGVTFEVESMKDAGMCPTLYNFEQNREYLVFAYGRAYEVRTVCSDTWEIPSDKESPSYELMQSYLKNLGSFWFRFRARLNPF